MIASAAEVNGCVVTDNDKDFYGIETINPVRGVPG